MRIPGDPVRGALRDTPLHILHIVGSLGPGGAERLVYDLAIRQRKAGHQVSVALLSRPGLPDHLEFASRREQSLTDHEVTVFQAADSTRALSLATRGIRSRTRSTQIDVIHAHLMVGAIAAKTAMRRNAPIVITFHSTKFGFPRQALPISRSFIDSYVGCGKSVSIALQPFLGTAIATVPNGIDLTEYSAVAASRSAPRADRLRVISVGGLRPPKSYPRLIDAAVCAHARLRPQGVDLTLSIVGDGKLRPSLDAQVDRQQARDYIKLLGTRSDISGMLASADCFAMASDWEGLPLSLIEAMASGLPSVLTPFDGAQWISQGGRTSLIAGDFSVSSLADGLTKMAIDSALRAKLSHASVARATEFSIDRCAAEYERVYLAAIDRHRG